MKGFRDYDMNRRVATDAEGRDLLRKLLNEKEEEREEKLAKTTLDETNTVKFKDGAFEHVSSS
jgi:transcription antitermination factor NusG